jgi:hypothetical protein
MYDILGAYRLFMQRAQSAAVLVRRLFALLQMKTARVAYRRISDDRFGLGCGRVGCDVRMPARRLYRLGDIDGRRRLQDAFPR